MVVHCGGGGTVVSRGGCSHVGLDHWLKFLEFKPWAGLWLVITSSCGGQRGGCGHGIKRFLF